MSGLAESAKERLAELATVTDRLLAMALDQHGTWNLTLDEWQSLIDQVERVDGQ